MQATKDFVSTDQWQRRRWLRPHSGPAGGLGGSSNIQPRAHLSVANKPQLRIVALSGPQARASHGPTVTVTVTVWAEAVAAERPGSRCDSFSSWGPGLPEPGPAGEDDSRHDASALKHSH